MRTAINVEDDNNRRPIGALGLDAKALVDHLRLVKVGEVATYCDLSALLGRDCLADGRGALNTARKILERENQIVFDVVRGIGLRHLTDGEAIRSAGNHMRHIHRTAIRGAKRAVSAKDLVTMSSADRIQMNALASGLGAIAQVTQARQMRRLEAAVEKADGTLPLAKYLDSCK